MTYCCTCGKKARRKRMLQRQTTLLQEEKFRVDMQEHGNQGVQTAELMTELSETALVDVIPQTKLKSLLQKADLDKDSFITYNEFMNMYSGNSNGLTKNEKSAMRRFVGAAVENIVPRSLREDFLANYTCKPPPIFMVTISVVEIAVFIYYASLLSREGKGVSAFEGLLNPNVLMYMPERRWEAWRFLSYMLVHHGYVHLLSNLVFQLLLGVPLEIVHKWWRLTIVYFAGVIGGSLAHSVTDFNINLVGASGGCYAIIGAHIASVVVNWSEMNYKCSECNNPIRIMLSAYTRLFGLLVLVIADTSNAVYRRFYVEGSSQVGITAHVGGFITGLLLGISIMKNINIHAWERHVGWVALAIFVLFVLFCLLFNGLYQGYPETDFSKW